MCSKKQKIRQNEHKKFRVVPFTVIKKRRRMEKSAEKETLIRLIMSKFEYIPFILRAYWHCLR